ncbi:MAG: VOC family protein [Trueperaceae bacterium]|nr:VOC family protein [Trueperaceae bacterium]
MNGEATLPLGSNWGPVHLSVTDLERAKLFWTRYVGLEQTAEPASLGVGGRTLIVLHPDATAPVTPRRTGLYHVALHVTNRRELALVIARLHSLRYQNSPTDHTMSETTYLWDPDGHGIEITLETPERGAFVQLPGGGFAARRTDGTITSGRDPVDLDSLFAELDEGEDLLRPLAPGTRVGHVHLHVADLAASRAFYRDVIGFELVNHEVLMQMSDFAFPGVAFKHSLAINTWSGVNAPPPPPGTASLRSFTLVLPTQAGVSALVERLHAAGHPFEESGRELRLADPSGNVLLVQPADS